MTAYLLKMNWWWTLYEGRHPFQRTSRTWNSAPVFCRSTAQRLWNCATPKRRYTKITLIWIGSVWYPPQKITNWSTFAFPNRAVALAAFWWKKSLGHQIKKLILPRKKFEIITTFLPSFEILCPGSIPNMKRRIQGLRLGKRVIHPAAFIFEGFNSEQDYYDAFCPPETRKKRGDCRQTRENGTLAARFERYVWEYDGRSPFDSHLCLQVPLLSIPATGRALHVDEIYNITAARVGWEALAKRYHVDLPDRSKSSPKGDSKGDGGVITVRSRRRRLSKTFVTDRTKQRICELGMLDYCCLNLPLPPPCENLYCRMDKEDDNGSPRIMIQPWSYPQSSGWLQSIKSLIFSLKEFFVEFGKNIARRIHSKGTFSAI